MRSISRSNVIEFIEVLKYYKLFQEESVYKVVCPFHGDKNPSMQINVESAYFYCYGCGVHGTTYDLVKAYNPDFSSFEIYKFINEVSKEKKGVIGVVEEVTLPTKHSSVEELRAAKDFYYNLPDTNWYKAKEEAFEIKRYMINRGFSTRTLINNEAKATYNKFYPIVFPLLENGIFRGYVMRTNDPNVEANRKYMYNRGFLRKKCLAGSYVKEEPILLVEGYLDCLAAKQLGVKNVAAILGWKISHEQIKKLKSKGINKIICGLDNDKSGRNGYEYLKRIAKLNGFKIYRIRYPKKIKDFGDLLKAPDKAAVVLQQIHKIK